MVAAQRPGNMKRGDVTTMLALLSGPEADEAMEADAINSS